MKLRLLKWPLLFLVLTFVFVNVLASSPLPYTNLAQAAVLPTMYVHPPSVIDSGLTPGTSFTVDIMISDADIVEGTDVYAWQVCVKWDPLVVDVNDTVIWGDFLDVARIGPWGVLTADAVAGQKIVNVADGTKFTANYVVLIEDDSNSEWNEVASVSGTQLTMKNNLLHTYTVAANGGAYPKPDLFPTSNANHASGRIITGVTTQGPAPGVSGDGWLCTFTFHVQDYGETDLDIDYHPMLWSYTFIINTLGETLGDEEGEINKESGFFSNIGGTQYTLTISVIGSGTTNPTPGAHLYDEGLGVPVDAIPDSGWELSHWLLDGVDVGSADPYTVTMDDDHTLTAVFTEITVQYELTIGVVGSGTTDPSPGTYLHDEGSEVPVDAIPDSGYMLDYWLLDGVNVGSVDPYTVTMNADHTLTAYFVEIPPVKYDLTISIVGSGTTNPSPGTHQYDAGSEVPVDAIPDSGWELSHWLLDGVNVGSTDPYTVTMNADHTLTAVFTEIPPTQYTLTISAVGFGTTDPSPGAHLYDAGLGVPVDAIPDSGYMLDYWFLDGVNVGSADPYTVTMNADHTLTAYFVEIPPIQYILTISVVGSGTTVPSPDTYTFDAGTEVAVASIPDSGWMLDHWLLDGVDVGSADPYTVTMNDNHTLTAVFVEMPTQYTLTIDVVGSGTTVPAPGAHSYDEGTLVPVDAQPASGWMLNHWLLDGVDVGSADPYSVTMNADHALTAVFTEIPPTQYVLTIDVVGSGTTDPSPGTYLYDEGSEVPVDAIPDSGWMLDHWLLDGVNVGSADPYTVTMNDNHSLTAVFTELPPTQYTLTISVTGSGTTDPAPGAHLYDEGLGIPVDAIPDSGWMLDHWLLDGVDVGSTDPYTVTMNDDHTLTAVFTELSAALMYVDPSVVSASPGDSFTLNINIQNVEDLFAYEVKLGFNKTVLGPFDVEEGPFIKDQTTSPMGTYFTYIIDDDYVYVACVTLGKYPGVSGSGNLFTVTFNVLDTGESNLPLYDSILLDSTGTAIPHSTTGGYFSTPPPTQYELTISVVGSGTTDPVPSVHLYDDGTLVPVDAIPDSGWMLDHWLLDGVDVGSADPYTVTMNADHTLTAVFTEISGVDVTPPTITINAPVAGDYPHSEAITLDFNAVDTESGVASISATLNGMTVENGDLIELFTLSLGLHTLTVTAVDNAGNSATETVEFNVIATIDSLIGLVEKFYDLGYIDEEDIAAGLINKLYNAQKKIEQGKPEVAKKMLKAFINQLKAQSGKHITVEAADILLTDAQYVLDNL